MGQRFKGRVVASRFACAAFAGLVLAIAVVPFGCSRNDADEAVEDADTQEPEWVPPHRHDAGIDAGMDAAGDADAGRDASDGRAEHQLAVLVDAGRFCGARDLHDCPLQGWMKRNATTMLEFGDISTLGLVFDQIATFAPVDPSQDSGLVYANWKSIAVDGADATRMGNLNAAKAACRGCHSQYRASYHANMRAREIPAVPLVPSALPSPSPSPSSSP